MLETKNNKFLITVVVPIYNTEKYLKTCLDSIVFQSLGFKKNIQIILIDDGSTDQSQQICLAYQKKYPKNILYKYKENGGVSSACNMAFDLIQGKYTNFFSSDDIWDLDALELGCKFFDVNYDFIDMVACRFRYFEGKEGFSHPLDWKYSGDYIVDLTKEYDKIILSGGNCIFKTETLANYRFDERLRTYEDACLIGNILINNPRYGVLKSAIYNYRKRQDQSSLISTDKGEKSRFLDMPRFFLEQYLHNGREKYGTIPNFVQYSVMYVLQWHLKGRGIEILTAEERNVYSQLVIRLIQQIDDLIIYKQKNINLVMKHFVYRMKYGKNICDESFFNKGMLYYKNTRVVNFRSKGRLLLHGIKAGADGVHIQGVCDLFFLGSHYRIGVWVDSQIFLPFEDMDAGEYFQPTFTGDVLLDKRKISLDIPPTIRGKWLFAVMDQNGNVIELIPEYDILEECYV